MAIDPTAAPAPARAARARQGAWEAGRFAPPPVRLGSVPRRRPLARLRAAGDARVLLACAPAGYGKTFLLAQWAASDRRPVAWIGLGPEHRDAAELESDLLAALAALAGPGRRLRAAPARTPAGRVRRALAHLGEPVALVIDDAHLLRGERALEAVGALCDGLPPGSHLALGCRAEPGLRLGLLAARGLLVRLGPDELAMDDAEASRLGGGAAAEGWPAVLALAAAGPAAVERFLEEEVVGELAPDERALLEAAAVLGDVSPGACDAVLRTSGSGEPLRRLERAGVLAPAGPGAHRPRTALEPVLRARLERAGPARAAALHRRACDWHAAAGDADRAIAHAAAAGDIGRAADLVAGALPGRVAAGRLASVGGWLAHIDLGRVAAWPSLAAAAAWCELEGVGGPEGSDGWVGLADEADTAEAAMLRAADGRGGAAAMRAGADAAAAATAWRALGTVLGGIARDLAGDDEGARARLADGVRRAGPARSLAVGLGSAWLALMAQREGAWDEAERRCAQADATLARDGAGGCATAALAHAAAARGAARAGRAAEARMRRARARDLLAAAPGAAPWRRAAVCGLLAHAAALQAEPAAAGPLLADGEAALGAMGEAPGLAADLARARAAACGLGARAPAAAAPLSAAEARVLRFLPTHLSFREIGLELHVSRFTVKSQALAAYRKLGATSRGDAVARARALGLLEADRLI